MDRRSISHTLAARSFSIAPDLRPDSAHARGQGTRADRFTDYRATRQHFCKVTSRLKTMSILKGKPDAGQGGKLGHSNQDHWEYTEEIKEAAKKRRRLQAKR